MAGSIRNYGRNKWQLQVYAGSDVNGKPIRYTKVFTGTKRDAQKELTIFSSNCLQGKVEKSTSYTLSQLADQYQTHSAERFLKNSSQSSSSSAIKVWIKPNLGKRTLNKITRLDVQKFVNLVADSKSPKTVRNIYSVLRSIFSFGIDIGVINISPCMNIKLPKNNQTEAAYYDKEQTSLLLDSLNSLTGEDYKYKLMTQIAIFGGLRKGEILGLNWEDIDFAENTISIKRTRMIKPGIGIYEDTPKTNKSKRTIKLPVPIFNNLKRLKAYQSENQLAKKYYKSSPAVFRNEEGLPLYPQVFQRWFKRFCDNNDIEYKGLHALRHTHASILADMDDVDLASISNRLGHSQLSTTLNIYTHIFKDKDKNISENLTANFNIK